MRLIAAARTLGYTYLLCAGGLLQAHAQTRTFLLITMTPIVPAGIVRSETTLSPGNVNATSFGWIATVPLDDQVDAQPLLVAQQSIGGGSHAVVDVATESNTVYAIDANSGTSLLPPKPLGGAVRSPSAATTTGPKSE